MSALTVLDLFSAAAGGWSLGLHRAGFETVAACEFVPWRRALYAQNNPGVLIYDDVRTLTADRIVSDLGFFPWAVVGSPPCQDISSANTKGKGVEGERSGLYFEAIRIIGEGRPCWVALENSANLRTRGADRVVAALEAIGYAAWAFVVGADDIGANHERKRSWIIAFDPAQVGHGGGRPRRHRAHGDGSAYPGGVGVGHNPDEARQPHGQMVPGLRQAEIADDGRDAGRGDEIAFADAQEIGRGSRAGNIESQFGRIDRCIVGDGLGNGESSVVADTNGVGRSSGRRGNRGGIDIRVSPAVGGAAEEFDDGDANGERRATRDGASPHEGCRNIGARLLGPRAEPRRNADGRPAEVGEMGGGAMDGANAGDLWPRWNGGFASHLQLHDGLSAELAGLRVDVGDGKRASAASLIVEAFGDAVVPQIPEAIGRAILRVERAVAAVYGSAEP